MQTPPRNLIWFWLPAEARLKPRELAFTTGVVVTTVRSSTAVTAVALARRFERKERITRSPWKGWE